MGLFAGVGHGDDARRVPYFCRASDEADFFGVEGERGAGGGDGFASKEEVDALAVDLAAGANALDNFLAGVAAFGVADVGVLQARFVRDLFLSEIITKPRDALGEATGA